MRRKVPSLKQLGRPSIAILSPPNRCRELREAAGLTLAELAAMLDVKPPSLHDYETEGKGIGKATIYRAAEILHATFDILDRPPTTISKKVSHSP